MDKWRYVRNSDQLLNDGWKEGKRFLLETLDYALTLADPYRAAQAVVQVRGQDVIIAGHVVPRGGAIHFIGAGKASAPIAEAVEEVLGDRLAGGICVLKRGQQCSTQRLDVWESDHPIPTDASFQAGRAMMDYAAQVRPGEVVICGITGGSSALVSLPPRGVPWEEKAELHRLLLASGIPIGHINTVRKHVSRIKGGRLAEAMPEARIFNLTVSDVAGDALDLITDPTVVDTSTYEDARAVLRVAGLWHRIHPAIRDHLVRGGEQPPQLPQVESTTLLVTGTRVADAVAAYARQTGVPAFVYSTTVSGEAREVGRVLAAYARERLFRRESGLTILVGGETTATVPVSHLGAGGPNMEMALSFGCEVHGQRGVAFLSADSDGQDGSTELAGAIADGDTVKEVMACEEALTRHEALSWVRTGGFGIETGQTRTNINDISLLLVE